jgi:hypothetical protein
MSLTHRHSPWRFLSLAVGVLTLVVVAVPSTANAKVSTFERFEVNSVAIYRDVTFPCADGTTASLAFRVSAGHETEVEDGDVTEDSDFLSVFVNGIDCNDVFVNDTGVATGTFAWSPSLQSASTSGTVVTRRLGITIDVDMSWESNTPMQINTNVVSFPGRVSTFVGQRRDGVANGTIVFDGRQFVNGPTTEAWIETFDDKTVRTPAGS